MKYAWIDKLKTVWPVTLMCPVLEVSVSGFFEHRQRGRQTRPQGADTQRTDDEHKLLSYFPPETDFEGNLVRVPRADFTTATVDVKKYVAWLKANGYALAGQ